MAAGVQGNRVGGPPQTLRGPQSGNRSLTTERTNNVRRPTHGTRKPIQSRAETTRRGGKTDAAASCGPGCPVSPSCPVPPADAPFDIPESWVWVRLGELFQHNTGKALNSADKSGTPLEYITTSNVYWNRFDLGKLKTMCFTDAEVEKCTVQKGDLLVLEGGDIGRAAIWNYDFPMRIQNHIHRLRPYGEVCIEYFYHVFYYLKSVGSINGKGIGIKGLSANVLHSLLIPLPPPAEQKRIVAKIEELLPYIDRYEKAWSKLEDFNKRFPGDMQKSLLQMAIQGKLVEQRPEEGTGEELYRQIQSEKLLLIKSGKIKKEKPLPEITPDEIPFDIPANWKWVSVGSVCTNIQYGSSQKSSPIGKIPVLRMGNIQDGRVVYDKLVYTSDDSEIAKYHLAKNDLLFNRTNSKELVGKTAIYKGEMPAIYAGYLVRISPIGLDSDYLNYVMQSKYYWTYCQTVRSDAIGQSNINAEKLKRFQFPLPPLAEQKRIVAKLEELLPLCERLK